MVDPFDTTNSDTPDNQTANFFRNLQAFGGATMQAANTYGPNGFLTYGNGPAGAIGVGLNAATSQARENAQAQGNLQKTQAETQGLKQQNQLFPLQMQMMRSQMNLMNNVMGDQGQQSPSLPQANPPVPTAGMSSSPSLAGGKSSPQSISRPSDNQNINPYGQRAVGASTGFVPSGGDVADENMFYKDMLSKIDGTSPAMQAKLGQGYQPTLRNIISVRTPPSENNTEGYLQGIVKDTGINPDQNIRASQIPLLQKAILKHEGITSQQQPNNAQSTYEQQIQPNQQEKAYVAMDKFMPGIGKIGEAQYQARIAPIVAAQKAQAEVSAAGARKTAEDTGSNLADTTKSFNAASANLPRAMERFEELRRAAPLASYGGWGTDENKDDPGFKIRMAQQFDPKTATANNVISQISSQGILPEVGPVIQATGGRGNQFMEKMAATASGIKLADPPETKTQAIQNVRDQYIAQLKSLAAQKRAYGDNSAPTDEEIDKQATLAENHAKLRMDAKEAIGQGAPRNAVIRRLGTQGIDTDGL